MLIDGATHMKLMIQIPPFFLTMVFKQCSFLVFMVFPNEIVLQFFKIVQKNKDHRRDSYRHPPDLILMH